MNKISKFDRWLYSTNETAWTFVVAFGLILSLFALVMISAFVIWQFGIVAFLGVLFIRWLIPLIYYICKYNESSKH